MNKKTKTGLSAAMILMLAVTFSAPLMADDRIDVVQSVYAHGDGQDEPPGGYDIWAEDISSVWRDMLERAAQSGSNVGVVFPPAQGGDLSFDVTSSGEETAEIFTVFDDGKSRAELTFDLREFNGDWRIVDVWREDGSGNRSYISEMLQNMP